MGSAFAKLRRSMQQQFPKLPEMPPKSAFLKHISMRFMHDRQKRLRLLLDAVIAADPMLENTALRGFLGIADASQGFTSKSILSSSAMSISCASAMTQPPSMTSICELAELASSEDEKDVSDISTGHKSPQ